MHVITAVVQLPNICIRLASCCALVRPVWILEEPEELQNDEEDRFMQTYFRVQTALGPTNVRCDLHSTTSGRVINHSKPYLYVMREAHNVKSFVPDGKDETQSQKGSIKR